MSVVPSSAESLDPLNVARHLFDSQIQGSLLLRQKRCLGGEDIEIRIHSRSVARNRKIVVFLRSIGCRLLLYQLLCEQPLRGELGSRRATPENYKAQYEADAAAYREAVLTGFRETQVFLSFLSPRLVDCSRFFL